MKALRFLFVFGLLIGAQPLWSANEWQMGRIVDVQKSVNTKTLYWIVNTPVTQDEITYTVSIHVKDKILTGTYELGRLRGAPPEGWVKDFPVKLQIDGNVMYLKQPDGDELKLNIVKRKPAPMMRPITPAELTEASKDPVSAPPESLIGFSQPAPQAAGAKAPSSQAAAEPAPEPPTPTVEQPKGTISISTVPYLADIYVDGKAEGYTPAKLTLLAGKHTVRLEKRGYKAWSKEVMVTAGSDSAVAATLDAK